MATNRITYHVRLDPDVADKLNAAAKQEVRTTPKLIEYLIVSWLRKQKGK